MDPNNVAPVAAPASFTTENGAVAAAPGPIAAPTAGSDDGAATSVKRPAQGQDGPDSKKANTAAANGSTTPQQQKSQLQQQIQQQLQAQLQGKQTVSTDTMNIRCPIILCCCTS
jgi:hypothetical protein